MSTQRPYTDIIKRLKDAELRPTRQRLALAKLLFGCADRHVTAEQLHMEAREADVKVSLATIYNTLHQFTERGLLREVVVDSGRSYFDTNVDAHHHFYHVDRSELHDIPGDSIVLGSLPTAPDGTRVDRVDVIVRITGS